MSEPNPNVGAGIQLRDIEPADLPKLYEYQLDDESNQLALTHPRSAAAFDAHWERILEDSAVTVRAIVVGDVLAGCISCFKADGLDSVGYWIGREFWGNGLATQALTLLLDLVPSRPLHSRVASTNTASLRVLQKCGFEIVGYQQTPGDDRFQACEETILELPEDRHQ